jgi:putative heme-binding domain-containing protein
VLAQASQIAAGHNHAVPHRLAAIALLAQDPSNRARDLETLRTLVDPREVLPVSEAAVQGIARAGGTEAVGVLLGGWSSLTRELRGTILDTLLSREEGPKAILAHLESGTITPRQLDAGQRQALLTHPDEAIRRVVEERFAGLVDQDRLAVIEAFRPAGQMQGDAVIGQAIYEERCAKCHQVGDLGFVVGPDLAAAGSGSFETLLTAILDPNRAVEGRYTNYTVETLNLETFSGVLAAESANSITLVNAGGVEHTVLRSDIESMTASDSSIMPLGLEEGLQTEDMAHLIAFIRGQTNAPKEVAGNHPERVTADTEGHLKLLASNAEIYGDTLVYEDTYRNLGYWASANDHAAWTLDVPKPGTYDVEMEYCCDNTSTGNRYRVEVGPNIITGTVRGTGTWDRYFTVKIGQVSMQAGEQRLVFRPDGPINQYLIDLRGIYLKPVTD